MILTILFCKLSFWITFLQQVVSDRYVVRVRVFRVVEFRTFGSMKKSTNSTVGEKVPEIRAGAPYLGNARKKTF